MGLDTPRDVLRRFCCKILRNAGNTYGTAISCQEKAWDGGIWIAAGFYIKRLPAQDGVIDEMKPLD